MPEITSQGALSRHITEYLTDNPRVKQYKCKTLQNPDYFYNGRAFAPVDVAAQKDTATDRAGGIWLRDKAIVSVGVKKSDDAYKLFGLRPDENQNGSEQFEVSIESIEINGKPQTINLRDRLEVSPITTKFGDNLYLQHARQRTRVMVAGDNLTESFKITLRLHLKGLTVTYRADLDEYWIFNDKGQFRFRLGKPYLVDPATMNPLRDADDVPYPPLVKHSLIEISKGEYRYVKEPTAAFGKVTLPASFLIDADTVYSSTADGHANATGTVWADVRALATGNGDCHTTNHYDDLALTAYKEGASYGINRSFFYYVLTAISDGNSIVEYVYGAGNNNSSCSTQLGTQAATLTTADFDSFSGSAYGNTASWSLTGYNAITYNAQGVSDVQAAFGGTFKTCWREYTKDYSNNAPTGYVFNGCWYADEELTAKDPYLYITTAAAGQPMIKRFGGIPFAALNRGVW